MTTGTVVHTWHWSALGTTLTCQHLNWYNTTVDWQLSVVTNMFWPVSNTNNTLSLSLSLSLSLFSNGHFPGEPWLAGVYRSKGWWRWWWQLDYWSYKPCKAPVTSSPPTNQHPFFTGRMLFLSPNQQCQSTEGKISHSMDLLTPSSPGGLPTLSLTTIAPGYLRRGLTCLSALWCQYPQNTNNSNPLIYIAP